MNEACSAGTGSFIEEQGRKFAGIRDVAHLGQEALARAVRRVAGAALLGVHGRDRSTKPWPPASSSAAIIAGLYDSIIQNYLNRVKGNRSVGQVIFCQGMPFSSDALAAAVARQTGSEVDRAAESRHGRRAGHRAAGAARIDATAPAAARPGAVSRRERRAKGHVRLPGPRRVAAGRATGAASTALKRSWTADDRLFTWGGGCSLHDKGTRKKSCPTSRPIRSASGKRASRLVAPLESARGAPRVALTDEFLLKGLFPFFATFIHSLGFDLLLRMAADKQTLKRGIQEANVPFCAPMQQFHGLASRLAEIAGGLGFLPMLRSLPCGSATNRTARPARSCRPRRTWYAEDLRGEAGGSTARRR